QHSLSHCSNPSSWLGQRERVAEAEKTWDMNKTEVLNREVDVDVRSGATLSVVLALSVTALLAALYYKILYSLGIQWYADPDYSHGFLVPLLSGYFVWERREKLRTLPVAPSPWGIVLLGGGLLMLLIGATGAELYAQRTSLIVVTAGLVLLMLGRERSEEHT